VLLSSKNISLIGDARRARKLTSRFIGPYTVTRVINANAYELALPPELRIHPVINVSQLKLYRDGSREFPYRPVAAARPPPQAADAHGQTQYEVERVVDHRGSRRGETSYLVQWAGYPPEEATWEPAASLQGAAEAVQDYHTAERAHPRQRRTQPRRGALLRAPLPAGLHTD